MNKNNQIAQGMASVGALAKPLDLVVPGLGTGIGAATQLGALLLPDTTVQYPINPYNVNAFGSVGYYNAGGTLPGGIGDRQISRDAFKVQGNGGIDNNYRQVEGQPAMLTQNEIVGKLTNGENYVYSDYLRNPLSGNTFAKDAEKLKKAQHQADVRAELGDPIARKTVAAIKQESDKLATINDMAIKMAQQNMPGKTAEEYCRGGKIKPKKMVLGGATELPQPGQITPEMSGWWGNPSVSQVPVVMPTPDPIPIVPPFSTVAPYPKQGDFWYGIDPAARAGIENAGRQVMQGANNVRDFNHNLSQGIVQGFTDYSTAIGRGLYGPGFQFGDIGPINSMARNYVERTPQNPGMRSRGIGASAYDPTQDPRIMGWQQYSPTNSPTTVATPTVTPEQLAADKAAATASTSKGGSKGSSKGSVGLDYIPGTEELTARPNKETLSIEDVKAGKTLNYTDPNWKGVKTSDFQSWLEKNHPGELPKFGVDGKWGSETESAWNKYGKEYLTFAGFFGAPPVEMLKTNAPQQIDRTKEQGAIAQEAANKKSEPVANDNQSFFSSIQPYIGDIMQGLAFAGQFANMGPATWEQIPMMDNRQIDPTYMQERIRAARTAAMQQAGTSYTSNQAAQMAMISDAAQQETQMLQQVAQQNKQLSASTQQYNNQARVQQQIARMQAQGARDAAMQGIWGSFANAGQALNEQYSNKVGQAALAAAYPLIFEGLSADMKEFLQKKANKTNI